MRIVIFALFLFCFKFAASQKKMIVLFNSMIGTQMPDLKRNFQFYYIVDSSVKVKVKGKIFYKFTFSEDSTQSSGFVRYDALTKQLLYLQDSSQNGCKNIYLFFSFGKPIKKELTKYPYLGNKVFLQRSETKDSLIFTLRYSKEKPSHSIYIKELIFRKDELYPSSITFYFPFENSPITKLSATVFN